MIHLAWVVRSLSEVEAEGWRARIGHCPDDRVHVGGRAWCSYCGSLKQVVDPDGWNLDGSNVYVGVPLGES